MRKILWLTSWMLGCVLLLESCSEEEREKVAEEELPSQIVDNFQMQESKSGRDLYFLRGRRAFYYDKRNEIVVLEPHITFYGPGREITSKVVCDSGVISNRTGDLVAYGNVVVTAQDSTILRTDSLAWFNRRAKIETDAEVSISSPQGTIRGKGLISDADLNRIEIKEEVKGTTPFSVQEESE
ncbi:LPS export ABC transporter periplasmic protein LptC [bacterium]|nr:LPS export ABC transporter periplasmic protein LptC [bacterium]